MAWRTIFWSSFHENSHLDNKPDACVRLWPPQHTEQGHSNVAQSTNQPLTRNNVVLIQCTGLGTAWIRNLEGNSNNNKRYRKCQRLTLAFFAVHCYLMAGKSQVSRRPVLWTQHVRLHFHQCCSTGGRRHTTFVFKSQWEEKYRSDNNF